MAGNDWINSYLEAILDVGPGLDDAKTSLLLRERGRFSPTRYFVDNVIGFDETDLHRSWVKAQATRSPQERNTRLENMCWRIWNLARQKKQLENEEAHRVAKRRIEREKGRRLAVADMSEDLSEGEKGDPISDVSSHGDSHRGRLPRMSSIDAMEAWANQQKGKKLYLVLIRCQTREGSSSADMCKSCSLPCNDNSFCTQVQSVLLLLGGRETAANMPYMSFTYHQNNRDLPNTPQRFNVPQRLASLIRFRERGCNGIKANLLLQSLFMKILPLQLQVGTRAKVDTQTADSIDVLHCYYAHGEDNENFQRRSYWMLDKRFENIVLVHYREVKEGYKPGFPHVLNADSGSLLPTSESSLSPSCEDQTVYTSDLNPVDRNQLSASSILNDGYSSEDVGISFLEQPTNGNAFDADKDPHGSGFPGVAFHPVPYSSTWNNFGDTITTDLLSFKLTDADNHSQDFLSSENGLFPQAHAGFEASIVNHGNCSDDAGGLKKLDNFGRWMDKEMGGDCEDSLMASDFGNYWNALDDKNQVSSLSHHMQLNTDSVDPSLPKEQLLSIFDFAPDWAYSGIETKVVDETDRLLGESYQPWLPTVL